MYSHYLSTEILHCALFQYADNSTLIKIVPSNDDRIITADEKGAD